MYNIMKLHVELLVQGRVAVKTLVASEVFLCKLLTHSGISGLRTQASLFETLLAVSVELKLDLCSRQWADQERAGHRLCQQYIRTGFLRALALALSPKSGYNQRSLGRLLLISLSLAVALLLARL